VGSPTAAQLGRVRIEEFADRLVDATVNLELHSTASQHLRADLKEVIDAFRGAQEQGVRMPLELVFKHGDIRHEDQVLTGPSLHAGRLLRRCAKYGIAALRFHPQLELPELVRLFDLFQMEDIAPSPTPEIFTRALTRQGVVHLDVVPLAKDQAKKAVASAFGNYQRLIDYLQDNHVAAYHGRSLPIDAAQDLVARTILQLDDEPADLFSLASQDNIDRFTVGHSVRVALLALQVGRAAGATMEHLVRLGTAALLHDIGKSKVPQEILFKQGHLDDEEWKLMAQHPRLGAEILMEERGLDRTAIGAAFCHHMSPAGGYPTPSIPFEPSGVSKLVRVCDVFEALTSVRPYKHALTPVEAYAVMYRQEHTFDPKWLQFFVRTLGLYPEGTRLRMDDGAEALVVGPGMRLDQPRVRLLTGPQDLPIEDGAPDRFTVGDELDGRTPRIEAVITPRCNVPITGIEEVRVHTEGDEDIACCSQPKACDHH